MISSLRGKVLSIGDDSFVLDVAGFGVEVYMTRSLMVHAVVGEELSCFAYMQISDSGVSMFGFSTEREKTLFLELLQVKTVGGKLAITLLRHLDAEQILAAITAGNTSALTVPGFGAKRAERVCFELKGKIAKKFGAAAVAGEGSGQTSSSDSFVMDALIGLGFSQSESLRAVSQAKALSEDEQWNEETLLKTSLSVLQKR
jgi:Holliday junction DNA helicase RuvA